MKVSVDNCQIQRRFVYLFDVSLDIRRWQSYVEPGDEMESGSPTKRISRNLDADSTEELLPLPENTLSRNLGLDLIVVVTKVSLLFVDLVDCSETNDVLLDGLHGRLGTRLRLQGGAL